MINLEDPEFEKYYIAYGVDQIEARYILSTNLVERIVNFTKKIGRPLYISFNNSRIYIAIPVSFSFRPVLFMSVKDYELLYEYYDSLSRIIGIVEDLNLNRRIWSKQPSLFLK